MSRSPRTGLASSRTRFHLRAQEVRRRPWRLTAYAAGTLAVLALLIWVVGFSPILAVRSVEVVGVPQSEVGAIRGLAQVPMGQPLARVDSGAVSTRVAQLATLADVSIERSWPSTLVIHASPRVPFLVVKNPQGELEVVDVSGMAYAKVNTPPHGVPVVYAASQAALSHDALAAAVSVLKVLPEQLHRSVSRVVVSSADLVTLTVGSTQVVWGGIDAPERKLTIMQALLKGAPHVIDVSAPDTPVTR